jgi:uncharacterized FAD-dependent dehydrogenase
MEAGVSPASIKGFNILKQSIDARGKITRINFSLQAFINESPVGRVLQEFSFLDVNKASEQAIIIGAGPAGLFAALRLLEKGIRPVIIERGKDVRSRRRDLARLNKEGEVNPESNYCFGEGGAGTYSDGKLYTRSSKRGDVNRILELFVRFGADERILYEAHPHIGTNKLPQIITAMRKMILDCGGKIHFEHKLTDIDVENGRLKGIRLNNGELLGAKAVILATGHSARDIFLILKARNITIEAKPFALGVRVEHPQSLIDISQYHLAGAGGIILQKDPNLPPASYTWVQQVDGKGVFSFCMCPGGIIAPAATSPGELVVNGWSPSRRNNPFANSGIVVTVDPADAMHHFQQQRLKIKADDPLLLMRFQEDIERKAFEAGGGKFVAPAMRLVDFTENRISNSLPDCSYLPGIIPAHLKNVLPAFIHARLRQAFTEYGKKMKGYLTNEAVAVATESRTSSPVRIPRDPASLQHPQVKGLFPCGEGAGYAGGIVSAAMDGERIAEAVASLLVSRSSH